MRQVGGWDRKAEQRPLPAPFSNTCNSDAISSSQTSLKQTAWEHFKQVLIILSEQEDAEPRCSSVEGDMMPPFYLPGAFAGQAGRQAEEELSQAILF